MEIIFLLLFLILLELIIFFLLPLKNSIRFMVFLAVIFIFLIGNLVPWFNNGFFWGKPDQIGYYSYAIGNKYNYSNNPLEVILTLAFQTDFHNFLYWALYIIAAKYSIWSSIITMRFLNFLAHLGIVYFGFKTITLLSSKEKATFGGLLLLFSPTLYAFDIYTIRDILIIFFTSLYFYALVKIFLFKKITVQHHLIVLLSLLGLFSLRGHLSFVFFILYILILSHKLTSIKRKCLTILAFIIFGLMYFFDINHTKWFTLKLLSMISPIIFYKFFIKWPLYFLGLGFLDPETVKSYGIKILFLSRLIGLDSLIVPILSGFLLLRLLKNKLPYTIKILFKDTLIAYTLYFFIYVFAEYLWQGHEGLSFRKYLPFFYIYFILIISTYNIRFIKK